MTGIQYTTVSLGSLLGSMRAKRGLSLRELGRLAEIDHAYISRLETGTKRRPSDAVVERLIRALKPSRMERLQLNVTLGRRANERPL